MEVFQGLVLSFESHTQLTHRLEYIADLASISSSMAVMELRMITVSPMKLREIISESASDVQNPV
jgi:hypothetical protein